MGTGAHWGGLLAPHQSVFCGPIVSWGAQGTNLDPVNELIPTHTHPIPQRALCPALGFPAGMHFLEVTNLKATIGLWRFLCLGLGRIGGNVQPQKSELRNEDMAEEGRLSCLQSTFDPMSLSRE